MLASGRRLTLVTLAIAATGCSSARSRSVNAIETSRTSADGGPTREPFAFHSNFWLNLHHFLYVTARARRGLDAGRATVTSALGDTTGFGALPASDQQTWQTAVAFYDTSLARRDILFDTGMVTVNNRLATLDWASSLVSADINPPLRAILELAAPVYRRLWWPRHDLANHRWEAAMQELLAIHGMSLAAQESRIFREPWSAAPVWVDVTAYANWAGAYTTSTPSHITIASTAETLQGDDGLETLFHEVLHTMDDTLLSALIAASREEGKSLPRDPTHVFIFYTAGELTRRAIPSHLPYAKKYGLWSRSPSFARALPMLQQSWQPYLDGTIDFKEAIRRYAHAL